jgi:CRISPR/Cas system CSM-associated protein Csm5 (group 7 of RAMP superfamily)
MIKCKPEKEHENEVDLNEILNEDREDSVVEDESIYSVEKVEMSDEAENIFKALYEYVDKHNGNCFFHVGFGAFDKSVAVVDDRYDTYGCDDVIIISMEAILEELKQQKETED